MNKDANIYIAGHRGMVGSAIHRKLKSKGYKNFILKTSKELDLRNQSAVYSFFEEVKPDYVVLAAAKVGGINANNIYRAEFIYDNLMIQNNVISASHKNLITKLLFLGSSCIYPKLAPQPLKENYLLTGDLEHTNEPYAIAKIAGIKMCEAYRDQYGSNFISAMPTNLYGPNDNYNLQNSHVLPALLRKFIEAKRNKESEVIIWGTGSPKREFMHVDDLADACVFLLEDYDSRDFINVGTGSEVSILELAQLINRVTGFEGEIVHDLSKPDGTPRKLMDVGKLNNLGWKSKIDLEAGVKMVYDEIKDTVWNS
jgi:GDP-L-fucose synthase